jgi:hypothetical protein
VSHDVPAKVARRLEWTDATKWFVESATPAPDTVAWEKLRIVDSWVKVTWPVVLLVERLYPVNEYGHRISHATFMETRARFAVAVNGHDFQSSSSWQFRRNGEEPQ